MRALSPLVAASLVASLAATLLVVVSFVAPTAASAAPGDVGTPSGSLAGFPAATPTAAKPESKLWFASGSWWASMASTTTGGYRIHRLDRASAAWVDTGVDLDPRGATQGDVLWNGTHLFVASHAVAASSTTTSTLEPARLFRYSWNGSTWTPDSGFPVTITGRSVEALTIAQNAQGRIWATWTFNKRVYLAQTNASADASSVAFGTSFIPVMNNLSATDSTKATSLTSDDISTIVSADGVTTLAWSNQVTGKTWSARRVDSASTWAATAILSGTLMSDDHINLRAIPGDPAQRVVAVLKTSRNDASPKTATDPLLVAATYTPASGTWTTATVATVAESGTRPIAVVDTASDQLRVFYTGPSTAGIVAYTGTIYAKSSPLSSLSFPASGTPVLRNSVNATMNNATSSKQPATASSGVVVLAATDSTRRYWFADFGGGASPTASFTTSATSGTAPVEVAFTDTSTGAPTSWSWSFGDGGTSAAQNPLHTYTTAGTYTVTLTSTNDGGSTTAATTVTVTASAVVAPTASFTTTATVGTAPLVATFTDTSTGAPTSWAWSFGDGGTSTTRSPSYTFTAAGPYTVTLTATNSGGSTSASTTVVVNPAATTLTPLDRVNAGGPAQSGGWLVDTSASPSSWSNASVTKTAVSGTTSAIDVSDPSIPAGTPASLFQSMRYHVSGSQNMIWTMPVDGLKTYTVRLYFAETYWTTTGKRVFDVSINGTPVLTGFDIVAAAGGPKRGIVKTFTVTTGQPIVIEFGRTAINNPLVNAIEVLS